MALDPNLKYSLMTRAFARDDTWRQSSHSVNFLCTIIIIKLFFLSLSIVHQCKNQHHDFLQILY